MSTTEVLCFSACVSMYTWCKSYNIDDITWYWYSESKMVEDFPLIFGCEKRVYKNMKILQDKGFIELNKFGSKKLFRLTDKAQSWGRNSIIEKSEDGLESPKTEKKSPRTDFNRPETDENSTKKQSENGGKKSTNGPHTNILRDNIIIEEDILNKRDKIIRDKEVIAEEDSSATHHQNSTRFSSIFGFDKNSLKVKQSVIDRLDSDFGQLVFPIDDFELKKLYYILCCSPKWQKKTVHALQMSLNKMKDFDLNFQRQLIEDCIAGGWQGLVFEDTRQKYEKYLQTIKKNTITMEDIEERKRMHDAFGGYEDLFGD